MASNETSNKTSKKTSFPILFSWSLYDWANSAFPTLIITFIFSTYFSQAIAKDPITGTQQWGYAIGIAGFFIAILSPILGAIADKEGSRKPWVAFFSLMTMLSAALLWFAKPSTDYIIWSLFWVMMGTICFEVALVFYNAMMVHLVSKSHVGRLSGLAWGLGYCGGLAALLFMLFILQHDSAWLNSDNNHTQTIRFTGPFAALWFLIFSLPLFLFVPDASKKTINYSKAIVSGLKTLWRDLLDLKKNKVLFLFLLAHMFYMDALNTVFSFAGIYAANEFAFAPSDIIKFGIGANVAAGVGAACFAWLDDYLGSWEVMLFALISLIIALIGLLLVEKVTLFWIFALLLSFFVGPLQAASRSYILHISSKERVTESFGLYALTGKVTAFLGPWLVSAVTLIFSNQRLGLASVLIFLFLGLGLLLRLKVYK